MSYRRVLAELIGHERTNPDRRVEGRIARLQRKSSDGSVANACGIRLKRSVTDGRVGHASGVVNQCERSIGCVLVPVLLNKSAPAPVAVFSLAVLASSAAEPIAVLKLPVVLLHSEM